MALSVQEHGRVDVGEVDEAVSNSSSAGRAEPADHPRHRGRPVRRKRRFVVAVRDIADAAARRSRRWWTPCFGSSSPSLLKQVLDVGVVGDDEPVALAERRSSPPCRRAAPANEPPRRLPVVTAIGRRTAGAQRDAARSSRGRARAGGQAGGGARTSATNVQAARRDGRRSSAEWCRGRRALGGAQPGGV